MCPKDVFKLKHVCFVDILKLPCKLSLNSLKKALQVIIYTLI